MHTLAKRNDRAQRKRPQTGQANCGVSVVRKEARVAARNSENAAERFQTGSRVADLQRYQLRHRAIRSAAAGRKGLVGLAVDIVRHHALLVSAAETFQLLPTPG